MTPFWISVTGQSLAQGDYLSGCLIPVFPSDFPRPNVQVAVERGDLIVVTQSCDLDNDRVSLVALCPIFPIAQFEAINSAFSKRGVWEQVRRGRHEGLHLLASPNNPSDNRDARVVDFRQIISLPVGYLKTHANSLGIRWRLQSPFLEHFSQALARFFMRVGLPAAIPPYT